MKSFSYILKVKLYKLLVFTFIFLLIDQTKADSLSEIKKGLVSELAKRVSILDRELVGFRYETKNKFEPKNTKDVIGRIKGWPERFNDKNIVTTDMVGPGTYLALDPFSSRSFGGNNPQLYVLTLKRGIKVITFDGVKTDKEKEFYNKAESLLECNKDQIQNNTQVSNSNLDLFYFRNSPNKECREFSINILNELKIQAIFYPYTASDSLSDCRSRGSAINVISSEAIDFNKISFFSNENIIDDGNYSSLTKTAYYESKSDFTLLLGSFGDFSNLPEKLELEKFASKQEYEKWKKEKIYGCGVKWMNEKSITNDINFYLTKSLKNYYFDSEIQTLILQLRDSVNRKKQNAYFHLDFLVRVAKLKYSATQLPDDEETFKKYMKLRYFSSQTPESSKELKELLKVNRLMHEVSLEPKTLKKILDIASKPENQSPLLPFKLFQKIGMGSKVAAIALNDLLSYKGLVIISSHDSSKTFSQNFEISREKYKNALLECIDLYNNQNISFEDIQNTDCRIQTNWD